MFSGIRTVEADKDGDGSYVRVRVVFGPHHYVELNKDASGSVSFELGATHHGFKADASEVNGELEKIINSVRRDFPGNASD